MMSAVFRWFGFPEVGGRRAGTSAYAEALQAGWVPPVPELQVRPDLAMTGAADKPDIAAFLVRVYLNQHC